jgi:hypothetical protein
MIRGWLDRGARGFFRIVHALTPWHRLWPYVGVLDLRAMRQVLRAKNLHDAGPAKVPATPRQQPPPWKADYLYRRSSDGAYNDLGDPTMGAARSRFGRNVPLDKAVPEPDETLLEPSPRVISNRLLRREGFVAAESLNLLAAAWIQFMTHDWFHHGTPQPGKEFAVPLDHRPGAPDTFPADPMPVRRTPPDPTNAGGAGAPPTFLNDGSHWWDGSQVYGNNEVETERLRCEDSETLPPDRPGHAPRTRNTKGELKLSPDRLLPIDPATQREQSGLTDNWWVGLSLLHTLFAQEHNTIAARLRLEYPYWSGERIFHVARLINVALMAKIHTVEWTPAILGHPTLEIAMNANWWGLVGERITRLVGRLGDGEAVSGIPGSPVDHHGVPYSLTEEFVAVYRLHSLLPDTIRFHRAGDGTFVREVGLLDVANEMTRAALDGGLVLDDVAYSFGIAHPGALRLHNYPNFLRELKRQDPGLPDQVLDLAAIDVLRDRERGVPRYNEFRRLFHLKPARSFGDITSNLKWADELRDVYKDVERVDLLVGCLAEDLPRGFGFSDTQFRVFILMASRRLKSDRFFTTDFTETIYTPVGMEWIARNNMRTVLLRHFPAIAPALRGVDNAFAPWRRIS